MKILVANIAEKWTDARYLWAFIELKPLLFLLIKGGGENKDNPAPVKYAASLLNLSSDEVRLPLVKVTENTKKEVQKALKIAELL